MNEAISKISSFNVKLRDIRTEYESLDLKHSQLSNFSYRIQAFKAEGFFKQSVEFFMLSYLIFFFLSFLIAVVFVSGDSIHSVSDFVWTLFGIFSSSFVANLLYVYKKRVWCDKADIKLEKVIAKRENCEKQRSVILEEKQKFIENLDLDSLGQHYENKDFSKIDCFERNILKEIKLFHEKKEDELQSFFKNETLKIKTL
jgi:hypothetical protein